MKTYNCKEAPIKVFGIPFFDEKKNYEKVSAETRALVPSLKHHGRRPSGARIGFKTDATEFTVKITLETLNIDVGMSIYNCQSAYVTVGDRQTSTYMGLLNPKNYENKEFEKTFKKSAKMEDVTVWLPRNEVVSEVEIIVDDDAKVEAPTPYKYGPILYYGSSITESGLATTMTNSYNAILSRWLDVDYYNLGFSGRAKGELAIADYINTIPDLKLFVYDYDFNAPNLEHLENTHEVFFKRIREKNPELPILIMSAPSFDYLKDAAKRRDVIKKTYTNALAAGDKNVYFIDGETFFGDEDRELCTVDRIHPNDLGFYRMAKTILPVMKEILGIE